MEALPSSLIGMPTRVWHTLSLRCVQTRLTRILSTKTNLNIHLKGLNYNYCKNPDKGLPKPDKVFFLDLPPLLAQQREDYGEERYESLEIQTRVRSAFVQLLQDNQYIHKLDVTRQSIESVHQALKQELTPLLESSQEPLRHTLFM